MEMRKWLKTATIENVTFFGNDQLKSSIEETDAALKQAKLRAATEQAEAARRAEEMTKVAVRTAAQGSRYLLFCSLVPSLSKIYSNVS